MRNVLLAFCIILFFGCRKETNSVPMNAGGTNQLLAKASQDTYLPLTKNTHWKYTVKTDSKKQQISKLTVSGQHKAFNSKNYTVVNSVMDGKDAADLYYAQDLHDYYLYTNSGTSDDQTLNMEILFLKDNAAVGDTWLVPAGTANGFSLNCYGKIIDNNATITVSGKQYKHVIHSYIEIRKPFLFSYIVVNKQDFYTAENIGIVQNVSNVLLPSSSVTTTNITGCHIE